MGKDKSTVEQFEVTLAHKRSNKMDLSKGCLIQPKLDGVRCYTRLVGEEIKMFSRNHKEFMNCDHLKVELYGFFMAYPDRILDGELYNHEYKDNFNEIISIVRKQKPTIEDKVKSAEKLEYHVYDCFDAINPDLKYISRLSNIYHAQNEFKWNMIKDVDTFDVFDEYDVDHFEDLFLSQGYEGAMLRDNGAYEQRRSHGLQKVKRFSDAEFTITGFVEGNGKFSGGLGKFIGVDENGLEIMVPYQKCTIKKRKQLWDDRKFYLGKVATFEFFERTPAGNYRFPQFKTLRDYE